jgi:hypothetical protein
MTPENLRDIKIRAIFIELEDFEALTVVFLRATRAQLRSLVLASWGRRGISAFRTMFDNAPRPCLTAAIPAEVIAPSLNDRQQLATSPAASPCQTLSGASTIPRPSRSKRQDSSRQPRSQASETRQATTDKYPRNIPAINIKVSLVKDTIYVDHHPPRCFAGMAFRKQEAHRTGLPCLGKKGTIVEQPNTAHISLVSIEGLEILRNLNALHSVRNFGTL